MRVIAAAALAATSLLNASTALAQEKPPELRAGALSSSIAIDGRLAEPVWESAEAIEDFRQTDPTEGRLRWTFRPVADLFVAYNHNVRSILDRWRLDSNQLLIKLQYALRI